LIHEYAVEIVPVVGAVTCPLSTLGYRVDCFLTVVRGEDLEATGLKLPPENLLIDQIVFNKKEGMCIFRALIALRSRDFQSVLFLS
jgi:hypothetical protein